MRQPGTQDSGTQLGHSTAVNELRQASKVIQRCAAVDTLDGLPSKRARVNDHDIVQGEARAESTAGSVISNRFPQGERVLSNTAAQRRHSAVVSPEHISSSRLTRSVLFCNDGFHINARGRSGDACARRCRERIFMWKRRTVEGERLRPHRSRVLRQCMLSS